MIEDMTPRQFRKALRELSADIKKQRRKKLIPRFVTEWERLDWEREQRGEKPLGPVPRGEREE